MSVTNANNLRDENERLRSDVKQLRLRLEEAEQAIEGIRTGQVESLIESEARFRYVLENSRDVAYRLETRHFMRTALTETKMGYMEESTMEMDKDWTAVSFKTSRRGGRPRL